MIIVITTLRGKGTVVRDIIIFFTVYLRFFKIISYIFTYIYFKCVNFLRKITLLFFSVYDHYLTLKPNIFSIMTRLEKKLRSIELGINKHIN